MTDPLADTVRMIDNWERNAEEKAARFQAMSEQVEQISITESVAGGAVSATVGSNGIPTDISMTDKVREMPPQEIAANVMAAIRKAQSRYPARLAEILAETVGEDDPAGQHIVTTAERNFPPPPDDEAADEDPMRFSDVEEEERPQRPARDENRPQKPRPASPDDDDDGDVTIFRE